MDLWSWLSANDQIVIALALVNPASANKGGANDNLVRDNIRASIDAFRDDDHDGQDDDN